MLGTLTSPRSGLWVWEGELELHNIIAKVADRLLSKRTTDTFTEMKLTPEAAEARQSSEPGPFESLFFANSGRIAHKWIHYLPVYDRVLARYRGTPIRMLEIGVFKGGSLELWRNYFGPSATIFGIDINPDCATMAEPPNQIRIGSQADPAFLAGVVDEMGGAPDIVLDDGSHVASHQVASFKALWPKLKPGGVYIIEDIHSSYWPRWEGGYRRSGTAIDLVKTLIDDQHGWHHGRGQRLADRTEIGAIHVHDSIAVIEKVAQPLKPGHYTTGH